MKIHFFTRFTRLVIRFRWLVLASIAAFLVFCCSGIPKIYLDSSMDTFLSSDDPVRVKYNRFLDNFDAHEYVVVVVDAPATWDAAFIRSLSTFQDGLAAMPYVKRVSSILNIDHIQAEDDELVVDPFISLDELDVQTLAAKKQTALENKVYRTILVNRDATKLSFLVDSTLLATDLAHKSELSDRLKEYISQPEFAALKPRMSGTIIMEALLDYTTIKDAIIFSIVVFLLLIIGFYTVFRSALGVVLPLGIAALSIIIILGLHGITGTPFSIISAIVPSFLGSVGVASCVYLLTQIYSNIAHGHNPATAMEDAMESSALTCMLSSLTTAGALLTFSSSSVIVVQQCGIAMGVGIIISTCLTLLLVPITFSFVKTIKASEKRNHIILSRVKLLDNISDFVGRYYKYLIPVFMLSGVVAVYGLSLLKVDFMYLTMLKPESEHYQISVELDNEFGTGSSIEILFQGKNSGDINDPEVLRLIEKIAASAEQYPEVSLKTYSVVDIVKEVNKQLHDADPAYYRIPDSREEIAQYLLLFGIGGGTELERLVANDSTLARLSLFIPNMTTQQNRHLEKYLVQQIESAMKASPGPVVKELTYEITGIMVIWETINEYLTQSQIQSILLAMLVVCIVMIFVTRSLLLGMVMTLCNTFVVVSVLGFMGYQNIPLDPYLILVGAIALGILDDDTIHFVRHFLYEMSQKDCAMTAIKNTFRTSGQAIFYTTAIVTLSFLAYTFSELKSLNNFGLVSAVTVGLGMIVEFFLTPSILLLIYRKKSVQGY